MEAFMGKEWKIIDKKSTNIFIILYNICLYNEQIWILRGFLWIFLLNGSVTHFTSPARIHRLRRQSLQPGPRSWTWEGASPSCAGLLLWPAEWNWRKVEDVENCTVTLAIFLQRSCGHGSYELTCACCSWFKRRAGSFFQARTPWIHSFSMRPCL